MKLIKKLMKLFLICPGLCPNKPNNIIVKIGNINILYPFMLRKIEESYNPRDTVISDFVIKAY